MVQAISLGNVVPLRVVPPAALDAAERAQDQARAQSEDQARQPDTSGLAAYIRQQFETFKQHRNNQVAGWSERLLAALRAFNGTYDAAKLAQIKQFGGSEVYAKIVAMKCRGATSLLRDVYLSSERPWGIDAPVDPTIPSEIMQAITQLVAHESASLAQAGQPPDVNALRDRTNQLVEAARQAAKKKAVKQASDTEDKIDELLIDGGFYDALAEFLVDVPLFPFGVIKGPVVRIQPKVTWENGKATVAQKPRLTWNRVSPFDIWWTPGCSDVESAEVIERTRVTRAELNDLLDLPGYNQAEVRAVLDEYGRGGLNDNWDMTDAERAIEESRENPWLNRSGLINCLEYNGCVQGRQLQEQGMDVSSIEKFDPLRDYAAQAWLIGTHVIKVQLSPSPRKRHPYYITSFEKVPGTPVGNALPDILSDIAEVANATLRSLVNNMSMASGPQVVVNDDRLTPDEDGENMFPWKRWHVTSDPMGNNTQEPISFFMPTSNANELMQVYQQFNAIADDLSAIPRYMNGQSPGAAGRTSSGLAMLMGNSSKILQTVAANIDRDVLHGILVGLTDMILLTDTSGLLTGEENIRVMGVQVALQKETQRSRQLEFLQISANPMDMQIMGVGGRAKVLRAVSKTIGLDGEDIVPSDDQLEAQQKAMAQQQMLQAEARQAQGGQKGPSSTGDVGPRENLQQPQPAPVAGGVG